MLWKELESKKAEVQSYIRLLRQAGDNMALEFLPKKIMKQEQEGIEDLEKRLRD